MSAHKLSHRDGTFPRLAIGTLNRGVPMVVLVAAALGSAALGLASPASAVNIDQYIEVPDCAVTPAAPQVCEQVPSLEVTAQGPARVEFTASPRHCSDMNATVLVDGKALGAKDLGPGQSDGGYSITLSPGKHTVGVKAVGIQGGCNEGKIGSWGGNIRVTADADTPNPATPAADNSGAVLGLINQQRAANGCGPVSTNGQLSSAAARHAKDMLASGVKGHDGSDGSTSQSRVADVGYPGTWAEIVYWGFGGGGTPQAAVDWWMNSPGHRAIMLNCDFKAVGVSAVSADGKMTSVGVFGAT